MSTDLDTTALLERAVLSAALAAPWSFPKVAELLGPEHFSDRANRETYLAMVAMDGRGVPPDSTLLIVELTDTKKMSALRGPTIETVHRLLSMAVVPAHLEFYVEAMLQRSKARQRALELVASSNVVGAVSG